LFAVNLFIVNVKMLLDRIKRTVLSEPWFRVRIIKMKKLDYN